MPDERVADAADAAVAAAGPDRRAADASGQPAHRRRPHPASLPASAAAPAADRRALRHLRLDERLYAGPPPFLPCARPRAAGDDLPVRHAAHQRHAAAPLPRRRRGAGATSGAVADWSGGTRIVARSRRSTGCGRGACSGRGRSSFSSPTGWSATAVEDLAGEMDRLHRSCRRLIWLNPLLGYEGFEAKASGIRAMLPHVDEVRIDPLARVGRRPLPRARRRGQRHGRPAALARRGVKSDHRLSSRPSPETREPGPETMSSLLPRRGNGVLPSRGRPGRQGSVPAARAGEGALGNAET